jgi:SAM-dependent methyltransferase
MMAAINEQAAKGYAAHAVTYTKGRPEYPQLIVDWLRRDIGLGPEKSVLDLGAGTGKFTPRLSETGASVTALEPVPEMLAELAARNPGATARAGTADAIPFADMTFDAVVCAQSFHWFATEIAVSEIRRVLKPRGILGMVWNVRDERVPWVKALTEIIEPYNANVPRYGTMRWARLFPAPGFGPLDELRLPHDGHHGSPDDVIVGRTLSTSFIAALPPDQQQRVADSVRAVIAATPELAGKKSVSYPYVSAAYWCRKTA